MSQILAFQGLPTQAEGRERSALLATSTISVSCSHTCLTAQARR